jgi:hypothetical protein
MKTLILGLILSAVGRAQWPPQGTFQSGNGFQGGVSYRFATAMEPASSDRKWAGIVGGGGSYKNGKQHRYLWDSRNHQYFGYDMTVEKADSNGNCRVTISPLSLKSDEILSQRGPADAATYQALSLPTYPVPQIVGPNDTIALDLLLKPDGTQKVVDYIRVSCGAREGVAPASTTPPQDLSVQDVELRVVAPEVTVNGKPAGFASLRGESVGSVLWISIPGKGRFLLSLAPYRVQGFERAGTVRGSEISFQAGGDRFVIRSAEPLFHSDHVWNLYVRADAVPSTNKGMAFGAADRPEHVR